MRKCTRAKGVGMMKKYPKITLFSIVRRLLPIIFTAFPVFFIVVVLVGAVHGIAIGVGTYAFQYFFDAVSQAVSGIVTFEAVIWTLAGLAAIIIGTEVLNGVHNFLGHVIVNKTVGILGKKVNEKSARIDPIAFESPTLLNDINKAKEGMNNSVWIIFLLFMLVTCYLPYFLFMGFYLYSIKPIISVSLVLIFIPLMINQLIRSIIFARLEDHSAPVRRQFQYYEQCLVDRTYFKETRILGAFQFFRTQFHDALQLLSKKIWEAEKRTGLLELLMKLLTLAGYFCVLYLLFRSTLRGEISIGAFAAVFASIGMMFGIMEEALMKQVGTISQGIGTVRNFIRFLDLPERVGKDIPLNPAEGISLANVSFQYPEAESIALQGVTLEVKPGETIAIVGENGAGKSTLVKLMIGMYLPTEGDVYVGGFNTRDASSQSIFSGISAVFQKFQRYKMTLKDNIQISSLPSGHTQGQERAVVAAAEKADLDIHSETYPHGWDTMLSREFDGVDLSGGQWQRVAIARGFYRVHDLIVLDEPTAAIDPIEETRIYKKFAEISGDKTSIIVTHRMGSARIADRIVVMDQGRIVETGTHEALMQKDGVYAKMFAAQAEWYVMA